MKQVHGGHRKRLRDKIEKFGFESLYPHEFLEFILFASIPRKNTNDLAHRLISECGGYSEVFEKSVQELMQIEGIGKASAYQILSYAHHRDVTNGGLEDLKIRNLGEARGFFCQHFLGMEKEEFFVMLLDSIGNPIAQEYFSSDSEVKTTVPISKIMAMVADYSPNFVLFAHNHPSGNAMPSDSDIEFTEKIFKNLQECFNITNSEHMIFAGHDCYSFRQNGMLQVDKKSFPTPKSKKALK